MKILCTILLLCSAAVSQQAAPAQSSKHCDDCELVVVGQTVTDNQVVRVGYSGEGFIECYMVGNDREKFHEFICRNYELRPKHKAGAQPATIGKPATEKPEKKIP